MIIEKNTILYFSGTGNSLQVAKDISNELGEVELQKVASLVKEKEIIIKSRVLGIVFPVYYARLPLVVDNIVKKLNISQYTYVFAVATYGGAAAGVLNKLSDILRHNDVILNSGFLLRMPANYVVSYNPSDLKRQNKDFEREKKKVKEISNIIKERRNCKAETSKLIIDTIIDRILIKTTDKIMDNLYIKDKDFWVNDQCNGCRLCEKICPVKNIEFILDKPTWNHTCEQCTACIQYCPKEAIQYKQKTLKRRRYRNPNIKVNELMRE